MKLRVLIADDHLVVREGLRLIIETTDDMECAGEAADGREALRMAVELRPDIVVMDMRMPGGDGLPAIAGIREELPGTGIVILTTFNEDELMVRGLQAGANAFLLKDSDRTTLLDTLRAAARGESLLNSDTVSRLIAWSDAGLKKTCGDKNRILSERETEILSAVSAGERSKEIAWRLRISERTVKAHLSSIFRKLEVDSRTAAVTEGIRRGIIGGNGTD